MESENTAVSTKVTPLTVPKDLSKATPAAIAKLFKGRVSVYADIGKDMVIETLPTGLEPLDAALGCGGLPFGRIIEQFGAFGSGKTSLALHMVGQAQRAGHIACYIDAEHALSTEHMGWFGIDLKQLLFEQPEGAEAALDLVGDLLRTRAVKLIVVDSVAALVPQAEMERSFTESTIALQARMMSTALRRLSMAVSNAGAILIFINQTRQKIGVFMGNPTDTPGGMALKFYAGQRLEVRRTETLKKGEKVVGMGVKVKVVKNKVFTPFGEASLELRWGTGWRVNKPVKKENAK